MPDMAGTEAAGEVPVRKGMIEVVVRVATASVMADPCAVLMDVRRIGMSVRVVERAVGCAVRRAMERLGAAGRSRMGPATWVAAAWVLGMRRKRERNEEQRSKSCRE